VLRKVLVHQREKRGNRHPGVRRFPSRDTGSAPAIQISRTGVVALMRVVVRRGQLNQSLQQLPLFSLNLMPEGFPRFVALKECARVKEPRALE